jgi:threonine dehydratase
MPKKNELQNSFNVSRKQKPVLAADDIDRIADGIESSTIQPIKQSVIAQAAQTVLEPDKEEVIKTSLDFPVSLYEDMRISLFKKRRSMKDYIWELVRKDLYGAK